VRRYHHSEYLYFSSIPLNLKTSSRFLICVCFLRTEFPSWSGRADFAVVRILRKGIPNLGCNFYQLRERINEDLRAASGSRSKSSSRSTSGSNSPVREAKGESNQVLGKNNTFFGRGVAGAQGMPRSNSFPPPSEDRQYHIRPTSSTIVNNTQSLLPLYGLRPSAESYVPESERVNKLSLKNNKPKIGPPSTRAGHGSRRQPPPNQFKCSVFVSHIASGATWHDLQATFSTQVAPTLRVYMKPGCSWAHVYFYDLQGVEKAIEAAAAGMIKICGRPARVRRRTRKKKMKRVHQTDNSPLENSPPLCPRPHEISLPRPKHLSFAPTTKMEEPDRSTIISFKPNFQRALDNSDQKDFSSNNRFYTMEFGSMQHVSPGPVAFKAQHGRGCQNAETIFTSGALAKDFQSMQLWDPTERKPSKTGRMKNFSSFIGDAIY